ncbi:MAG: DUF2141 domain-containing protein [Pseudomonadota bacterium]
MRLLHSLSGALLTSFAMTFITVWMAHQITPTHAGEAASASKGHNGLALSITGIRPEAGKVLVMIYDDKTAWEQFDSQQMVAYREFKPTESQAELVFESLTAGPYAIALWHDEDGEGDLDMRAGYPLEGYGTSGARDAYDKVPFSRAAMAPGVVRIKMYYPDW